MVIETTGLVNRYAARCVLFALLASQAAVATEFDDAAELIYRRHIAHPPVADIPRDENSLNIYLASLDLYSHYHNPQAYLQLLSYRDGYTRGLGALITRDPLSGRTLFIPFNSGSAAEAGFSEAVVIHSIDGLAVGDQTPRDLSASMSEKQAVRVTGQDLISGAQFDKTLPLNSYHIPDTEDLKVAGQRVLRIHVFRSSSTVTRIKQWLRSLAQGAPVIIDLRYTTGGSLFESLDSASLFSTRAGPAASTLESNGTRNDFTLAPAVGLVMPPPAPVFLLLGPQTASAGEVFARALAHHQLAVTIGQTTFGKCVMQRSFSLPSGAGLTLTVGRLLDPAGEYCDGEGLAPAVTVPGDQIYNTTHMLGVVRKYRESRFLTCLVEPVTSIENSIVIGEQIGWEDGVGALRPMARKLSPDEDDSAWQYCLAPALTRELADAVVSRQRALTGKSLEVVSLVFRNEGQIPVVRNPD